MCRYRPRHELADEDQKRVQRYTVEIARAWNIKFPPGSNPELQLMGHLWEPLKVVHKPLFVHLASEMSVLLTHLALLVRCLFLPVLKHDQDRQHHTGSRDTCDYLSQSNNDHRPVMLLESVTQQESGASLVSLCMYDVALHR